eukprot:TRINITY_DN34024_c0_g1_i1.p1 TRINITY_DN34024_c0_g1~~TRINITY_DN34024_c0_g1_i1.p1  ORF type:complete len:269 (+),score=23.54 TRINITY_DN34024_c0_g1_i1:47-808(+)
MQRPSNVQGQKACRGLLSIDTSFGFTGQKWESQAEQLLCPPDRTLLNCATREPSPVSPSCRSDGTWSRSPAVFSEPLTPCRGRMCPLSRAVREREATPLWTALQMRGPNLVEHVQAALRIDPEAAKSPFWEHHLEPPLCCAIRRDCGPEVIQLLIEHGADVHATNVLGQTALALLNERCVLEPATPAETPGDVLQSEWSVIAASLWQNMPVAVRPGDQRIRELLLQAGAHESTETPSFSTTWELPSFGLPPLP